MQQLDLIPNDRPPEIVTENSAEFFDALRRIGDKGGRVTELIVGKTNAQWIIHIVYPKEKI